ncbi:tRNA (guanosine(46)-N7)-methyltransferase TrmB [Clostridium algidicarnis]|uniref:tRNA (guanosine(46)-N7)-methyltransferase TrmB n=1 Tax=Clostridium algidicarnis TaxID=37659 RepID=UPI001C0D24E1|nr:tRNA (guanosine(46)-N7)-methyltransferase TrmB [Clostridium algidicarnis]MBU3195188.1 tRNA (guanosine(46)-N7)-methyltransferase TrmB [Clostridium algidicarnis]MBU3208144.1 tRNA (guanosine(46)-N7)-methyltransferase TrmB [Clostridium algidicarnis]MBU3227625.1 tRNA (guanosine(46)-N7)-methyltransferase TrmB [Clostridium algidicarnis]MBU3250968.1 tRNA (guanosine(46)-N7)-methyltransferase TrmB [Clostridium algidicarnis]
MRLRKKWWARPELEQSKEVITEPKLLKGKWKEEFKNTNPIYLELGCGKGKFISTQAQANKDINFIGIDLKDEVLVYALRKVNEVEREVDNIRLIPLEIAFIEEVFDKNEIDRIYINFCNPWPKLSHNKRRLTHSRFLERYKTFLKPGSEIWFKSDDKDLFDASLEYFNESGFELLYHTYDLHNSDFKENIMTEYEEKFRSKGMKIMFLRAKLK